MSKHLDGKHKVLLTGATGFIGRSLLSNFLIKEEITPVVAARKPLFRNDIDQLVISDISDASTFPAVCSSGIDIVVHLAGRAHLLKDGANDPLSEFRRVNVKGTVTLAQKAYEMGAKRFIFLSSIGVNGAETFDLPFTELSQPSPYNAYTISKWEAEQELKEFALKVGMEVVIIRPPMVYGVDAPGNFGRLLKVVKKNIPLPFANINNRRSLVALENLVDFIVTCTFHPNAANRTFLVSDDESISTSGIIENLLKGMNLPNKLFYFPQALMTASAKILNREGMAKQLLGSLELNISTSKRLLDWAPKVSTADALRKVGSDYGSL